MLAPKTSSNQASAKLMASENPIKTMADLKVAYRAVTLR
jgi:hypothetical protein